MTLMWRTASSFGLSGTETRETVHALCDCFQAGVQLLFLVGNDAWASSEDTKEILQLLGCPKALSTIDILWVRRLCSWHMTLTMADHNRPSQTYLEHVPSPSCLLLVIVSPVA